MKESVPTLKRAAILGATAIPGIAQSHKEVEQAAAAYGTQTQYFAVKDPQALAENFRAIQQSRADAVMVLNGPPHIQRQIPDYGVKYKLPAIYFDSVNVANGGLMSYGASITDLLPARGELRR